MADDSTSTGISNKITWDTIATDPKKVPSTEGIIAAVRQVRRFMDAESPMSKIPLEAQQVVLCSPNTLDMGIVRDSLPTSILYWQNGLILDLVYTIHNKNKLDDLGILADALEEFLDETRSKAIPQTVLDHFRQPHEHGTIQTYLCIPFRSLSMELQRMAKVAAIEQAARRVHKKLEEDHARQPDQEVSPTQEPADLASARARFSGR